MIRYACFHFSLQEKEELQAVLRIAGVVIFEDMMFAYLCGYCLLGAIYAVEGDCTLGDYARLVMIAGYIL